MLQGPLSVAVLLALTSCFIAGPSGSAYAQSELDKCNDVLKGDLQNRISASSQQAQSTLQFAAATFFSETESQAFSDYQNEARKIDFSKVEEGDQAHVDAHYGLFGGAVDFAHSYNHELSADEFHNEFNKHHEEYRQSTGQTAVTSSSNANSLVSSFASTVRDPVTIEAWKQCMITRSPQAGITALGFRDESGEAFINIFWMPGDLVGFANSIHVKFPQSDEFGLGGVGQDFELGKGSGQDFPVRFKDPGDPRANHVGFSVLVNGEVKIDGATVRSFASVAAVPRNFALDPLPPAVPPNACRQFPTPFGFALGPRLMKKFTVRFAPPLNTSQASFIVEAAQQCDVVPEVPDFSCLSGSADVPTDNGNHQGHAVAPGSGRIFVSLQTQTQLQGALSVDLLNVVAGPHRGIIVHRFEGTCDNRGLIVGNWHYFKNGQHEIPVEATFEMRLSENN